AGGPVRPSPAVFQDHGAQAGSRAAKPPSAASAPLTRASTVVRWSGLWTPVLTHTFCRRARNRSDRLDRPASAWNRLDRPVKATVKAGAGFLLLALLPKPLLAHDFWIEPGSFEPDVGALVPIRLRVGQHFEGDPVPRDDRKIQQFVMVGNGR